MIETCENWLLKQKDFILITIVATAGSSPRETDAWLAVSTLEIVGTIGGGRLEWDAIAHARDLLKARQIHDVTTVTLGPHIGQCCGGRVTLEFNRGSKERVSDLARINSAEVAARASVYIYGAGHVGRALANALSPLPLHVHLVDSRLEELAKCTVKDIEKLRSESPVSIAENARPNSAHVIMTHNHALDSLIAAAIFEHGHFSYLGIIGSKTKAASFRKAFKAMGISKAMIDRVVCPIGGNRVADKRPEVIAALSAAEILEAVLR